MRKYCIILLLANSMQAGYSQRTEIDSLQKLLSVTREDTSRVLLMESISYAWQYSNVNIATQYAQQGLELAKKIKFKKGEAYCINALGNIFFVTGNYPKALEKYLEALKIKEQLNDQRGIAISYANIGNIYSEQGENRQALRYMAETKKMDELLKDSTGMLIDLLNMGDVYAMLNALDTSLQLLQQAHNIALRIHDNIFIGAVLHSLGNIYEKKNNDIPALNYYRESVFASSAVNDMETLSKAYKSIAGIYKKTGMNDSCILYAKKSLSAAQEASLAKEILTASNLLSEIYKNNHTIDSAFKYQELSVALKDSLFNLEKIKQVQHLTFNEEQRQKELAVQKAAAEKERRDNLQMIGITIFIINLFFIVLLLSKRKTNPKTIEFLGLLTLLLLFEFISLLIDPFIGNITHHTPVLMLLISVIVASILVPAHHRLSEFMKEKLIHRHQNSKTPVMKEKVIKKGR
jgi:tetratricopeptide (TPR) repeat protein